MITVKKTVAYTLVLALFLSLPAGCAGGSGPASPSDVTEDGGAQGAVLKINGEAVYSDEFAYWVNYNILSVKSAAGEIGDWNAEMPEGGGITYAQYVMREAANTVITYRAVHAWADELGVELSEEDMENIRSAKDYDLEYYGDEDTLKEYMEKNLITGELYDYIYESNQLYSALYREVNGERGEKRGDAAVLEYAEGCGLMQAKQVMIANVDGEGVALSDAEIAENYAKMEAVLAKLNGSGDPAAIFDSLIEEYSEAGDTAYLESGYLFAGGEVISAIGDTCKELEIGGYSGIVESGQGCHIVLRLPIDPETIPVSYLAQGYEYTLRQICAEELFRKELSERREAFNVIYTINYDTFDLSRYL